MLDIGGGLCAAVLVLLCISFSSRCMLNTVSSNAIHVSYSQHSLPGTDPFIRYRRASEKPFLLTSRAYNNPVTPVLNKTL